MGGEEKRHQMMQNLFGDQSEEEEDELESEHESNPQLNSVSLSFNSILHNFNLFFYTLASFCVKFPIDLYIIHIRLFMHLEDRIENFKW